MSEQPRQVASRVVDSGLATPAQQRGSAFPVIVRLVVAFLVLAVGWLGYSTLSVEPEQVKKERRKSRSLRTRVQELTVEDFEPTIRRRGVVQPHNEVSLNSQVSGRIVRLHSGFEDGAFFSKNDILIELDPADYETAVVIAESQVARSETALAQEQTRANQARRNWEDLGYKEEPNELVLRKPQLREAEKNLEAAKEQLARAQRDLARTKVRAPFGGRVRQRLVGVGQSIGSGTALGTIFAVDFAEVRLPIPARDMVYLSLPQSEDDPPIEVELRDALGSDDTVVWPARIIRTEGALDPSSLDLYAIARVDDPFGLVSGRPPLRIGQPVEGSIRGRPIENVVVIPRDAVRQLDRIFLVRPDEDDPDTHTLERRTIEPVWRDRKIVVVRDPEITDRTLLATSFLVHAPNGAKVEIMPEIGPQLSAETGAEAPVKVEEAKSSSKSKESTAESGSGKQEASSS